MTLYDVLVSGFKENDFDGFELRLHSFSGQFPEMELADTIVKRDGGLYLQWRKPGCVVRETGNGWSMSLDVAIRGGRDHASLLVYRHYNSRALQLDVNMLTGEFPNALAEALGRTRVKSKRIPTHPRGDAEMIAGPVAEAS